MGRRKSLVLQYHNACVVLRIMEPYEMCFITAASHMTAEWELLAVNAVPLFYVFRCSSYTPGTVSKGFVIEVLAVSVTSLFLVT